MVAEPAAFCVPRLGAFVRGGCGVSLLKSVRPWRLCAVARGYPSQRGCAYFRLKDVVEALFKFGEHVGLCVEHVGFPIVQFGKGESHPCHDLHRRLPFARSAVPLVVELVDVVFGPAVDGFFGAFDVETYRLDIGNFYCYA